MLTYRVRGFSFAAILLFLMSTYASAPPQFKRPVNSASVIEVNLVAGSISYKVNSELVRPTPTGNLLYLLNRLRGERGANAPVLVLLNPRVPIGRLWDVDGIVGKAKLKNVRYFAVDRETESMTEITWGPVVPYSKNPSK